MKERERRSLSSNTESILVPLIDSNGVCVRLCVPLNL
jgi:hypothetical protein